MTGTHGTEDGVSALTKIETETKTENNIDKTCVMENLSKKKMLFFA